MPTAVTVDDLLRVIREEVDAARKDASREAMRERATDLFFGELPPAPDDPASVGYADLVSTDVADAVEAVMAEILPTLTSGPCTFSPLGPQDDQAADLESRAVHHYVTLAGGYLAFAQAIKSALLHRAGVVKVYWDVRKVPRYELFDRAPLEALLPSLDAGAELVAAEADDEDAVSGMTRAYEVVRRPRVDAVPLDEFLISPDAMPGRMDEARLVAQQRVLLRADLVALGFDPEVVDNLDEYELMPRIERTRRGDRHVTDPAAHKSADKIMCVDAYLRVDADGDGIAELRRCITAGGPDGYDVLLFDEPVRMAPFAVGLAYLGLFTWDGVSLADKLAEVQIFKTEMLRDLSDLFRRAARQRVGVVERDGTLDDVLTSSRGGVIRCKTPQGVFPIQEASLPAGSFDLLGYMDKVRQDKGGGAIDVARQAREVGGDSAHGVERVMSAVEQINAMVARTLAETLVKPTYRLMHDLLRQHTEGSIQVPNASGWEATAPAMWREREDMIIALGMSTAERQRRAGALESVIAKQVQAMENGLAGQLVGLQQVHRALVDQGRMADLPSPEQYWIDPQSPDAQQAAQQAQQAQDESEQQQQQLALMQYQILPQVEQIKAQSRAQIQEMQSAVETMKMLMEQQTKELDARIKLLDIETRVAPSDAASGIDALQGDGYV